MSKKKDLYLAKSRTLEELNKMVDDGTKNASNLSNPRVLLTSANKLLPEAEKSFLDGDEEHAYLVYMRYLELVKTIRKTPEYEKDKSYFARMVGAKKIEEVIKKCESLSCSLKSRYEMAKETEKFEKAEREKEISEAIENENQRMAQKKAKANAESLASKINGVIKANIPAAEPEPSSEITVGDLKNLMEQKCLKLLILDCRSNSSFVSNHVNHPNCISIPDDVLIRGHSAGKISEKLREKYPESYITFEKRNTFDVIVLYDWNSSYSSISGCLQILYDAITKWDINKGVNLPVVLQGGMRNMYYSYPTLLTNPSYTVNEESKRTDDTVNAVKKLDLVSYPEYTFDEDIKLSPVNNSHSLTYNNISKESNTNSHSNNNFNSELSATLQVDRSNKPQSKYSNKLPNGTSLNESSKKSTYNGLPHEKEHKLTNDFDSGDIKVKADNVNAALDDIIDTSQRAIKTEEEYKVFFKQELNPDIADKMQQKEKELEQLKLLLDEKDKKYKKLKEEHNELLLKDQERLTLPKIRLKPEEQEIRDKEQKKAKLDEYVMKLRQERKQKEKEQQFAAENNKLPPIVTNNSSLNETKSFTPNKSSMSSSAGSNVLLRPISQDASPISTMKIKDENPDAPRSNLLKRSHSHPNLAQQSVNEEDELSENQTIAGGTPNINRNLKPVAIAIRPMASDAYGARRREFQVVSSTEKQKTGLKNLGNTCYMNSVIQCIYHTTQLTAYFMNDEYKANWKLGRGPTRGESTEEVAAVVREMNLGHRSIALNDLKSVVGKYRPAFSGYDQQDSHEFLTFLLDWMHEELNQVHTKTPLKEQKNDGISDAEAATLAWNDFLASNQSKISELFCGQQKSCVKCLTCDKESVTFEPFFVLSVPIPSSSKKCDIQQCIDLYTSAEELTGFNCVHCKTSGRATKKIDLWRLPPYLIIHLQRFYYDGWWKKRLAEVDFPVENLDLIKNVKGRQPGDRRVPQFQLYGVSNHYGTMDGGHYTAYCRKGQWYKFDDQSVESINSRDVCTAAAYILFYGNIGP